MAKKSLDTLLGPIPRIWPNQGKNTLGEAYAYLYLCDQLESGEVSLTIEMIIS